MVRYIGAEACRRAVGRAITSYGRAVDSCDRVVTSYGRALDSYNRDITSYSWAITSYGRALARQLRQSGNQLKLG